MWQTSIPPLSFFEEYHRQVEASLRARGLPPTPTDDRYWHPWRYPPQSHTGRVGDLPAAVQSRQSVAAHHVGVWRDLQRAAIQAHAGYSEALVAYKRAKLALDDARKSADAAVAAVKKGGNQADVTALQSYLKYDSDALARLPSEYKAMFDDLAAHFSLKTSPSSDPDGAAAEADAQAHLSPARPSGKSGGPDATQGAAWDTIAGNAAIVAIVSAAVYTAWKVLTKVSV